MPVVPDASVASGGQPPLSPPPPLTLLQTTIDLSGRPAPQRLALEGGCLVLRGDAPEGRYREWPLRQIRGFQIEPSLGSCFLEARIDQRWVDLLRCPGDVQPELAELVQRLDKLCNEETSAGRSADSTEEARRALAAWASGRGRGDERSGSWQHAGRLLAIFRPFRGAALLLLALSLAAVAVDIAPPMLQGLLVDHVLKANVPLGQYGQLLLLLAGIVAGLLLFRIVGTLLGIWKGYLSSRIGTSLTAELRNALVKKLNELPLAYHDRNQVGMLMSRVAYDTETLHTLLYHMTSGLLLQGLQMAGIGVAMVYLNPKLALVTLLPMPLILACSWYFTSFLNPRHQHYWDAVGKQASALTGMLSGIRVVKAFVQEDREVERFHGSSRRLRDSRQTVDFSTTVFSSMMGFLFALGGLAVWYIGGRDVLFGQMTIGSLMAFFGYLAMFYTPLTSITESTTWFSNFFVAARRMFEVLDVPSEEQDERPAAAVPAGRAGVEFQHVWFGYDKQRPVLEDITFGIEPGQMVGVVGRSGSGKSTLVSLIGRLYEADAGRILVGGVDVCQLSARALRRRIGMVPQEPFLFRGPLAANITYGNSEAAPEEILRAAHDADAHDFILRKPLAYQTQVGDGGGGLSGGERQRLSIARALLFDPAILILDEATSSVDAESERAICDALRRSSRNRTTIAVAHRLSTLKDADRLLVFDQGRLIEQGTHDELLAREGIYRTLLRLQWNLSEHARLDDAAGRADRDGDGRRTAAELRWLEPSAVRLEADETGGLRVVEGRASHADVFAVRAFPGCYDEEYLSLRRRERSGHEVELGLVRRLADWPTSAADAVRRSLQRRYLLRPIREIRQVRTRGNQLLLSVVTDGGPARLELGKPGEGVQDYGANGMLLRDLQGNYYVIHDRSALPRHQRRSLALYFGD